MIVLLKFISALVSHARLNHIVLAVMALLIISCEPNRDEIVAKTKSLEAQQELKFLHNLQYGYFLQNSKYSSDLSELNYVSHKLVTEKGNALYKVSIVEASAENFKARATAVEDFDNDGQYNIWEIDQEGILKEVQPD